MIELREQLTARADSIYRQSGRHLKQVARVDRSGIDADFGVNRQLRSLIAKERIVLLSQITGEGQMSARLHERGIRGHRRLIGAVMLRNDRSESRILVRLAIRPWLGREIAGLEHRVRRVSAMPSIDRANDRELVEHRGLLRQMFAKQYAGQLRLSHAERSAIDQGTIRLRIPGVEMTRAAGHPEENAALAGTHRSSRRRRFGASAQQCRQRKSGESGEARLQHTAAIEPR